MSHGLDVLAQVDRLRCWVRRLEGQPRRSPLARTPGPLLLDALVRHPQGLTPHELRTQLVAGDVVTTQPMTAYAHIVSEVMCRYRRQGLVVMVHGHWTLSATGRGILGTEAAA